MNKSKGLLVGSLMALSMTLTACGGGDAATETSAAADAGTVAVTEAALDPALYETDADGNILYDADGNPIVIELKQTLGKVPGIVADPYVSKEVPIIESDLGEWVKTKEGFMFKSYEAGGYLKNSIMKIDENTYYFDANGYLHADGWVPVADGTYKYIKDYGYVYGFQEIDGNLYYITEETGRLEEVQVEIDGEVYSFDSKGRVISNEKWEEEFDLGRNPNVEADADTDVDADAEVDAEADAGTEAEVDAEVTEAEDNGSEKEAEIEIEVETQPKAE